MKVIFNMLDGVILVARPASTLLLALALLLAAGAACYTGPDVGASFAAPRGTSPGADAGVTVSGLPCEIAELVAKHCGACHADPPRTGAKSTLTSREALLTEWEGRPLGVVALERMRDTSSPMPPEGLLPEVDVAAFAAWVEAGMPEGTCGAIGGTPTAPVKLTCTSGRFWTEDADEGDERMTPGQACIACHTRENAEHRKDDDDDDDELEAPAFTAAGTVYRTLHEPDDCFGFGSAGVQVVLTGADGRKHILPVNQAGNFMTETPLALPYTASVVRVGKTRAMKTAQTDGDCNGCHAAEGGEAPGRIVGP